MKNVLLLPVRLLAVPVMLLLSLLSLAGRLVTNLSAHVVGPFLLLLLGISIFCLWQRRWLDAAFVFLLGVLILVIQFAAMLLAEIVREWAGTLAQFIRSCHNSIHRPTWASVSGTPGAGALFA